MAGKSVHHSQALIYGLVDPRTNMLFYVGRTTFKNYKDRLYWHTRSGRRAHKTRCARMIRSIQLRGHAPEMFVIEDCPADWCEAEQFWIAYFRSIGCRLMNHTIGGEGLSGMRHTRAAIEKTRQANLGAKRSEETKERLRASWTPERKAAHIAFCRTRQMSMEQREFLSRLHSGKTISPEQRAMISKVHKGRVQTEEQKRKSGAGIRSSWTPERKLEQAKRLVERGWTEEQKRRGVDGVRASWTPERRMEHSRLMVWTEEQRRKHVAAWTPERRMKQSKRMSEMRRVKAKGG